MPFRPSTHASAAALTPAEQFQLNQAIEQHKLGQLAVAEAAYRHILSLHPNHPSTLQLLGTLLAMQGNHAEAIPLMEHALSLNPAQPHVTVNLAISYRQNKDFDKAYALLKKCLKYYPDTLDAQLEMATLAADRGEIPAAIRHYRALLAKAPNHLEGNLRLGRLYIQSNQYEEAERVLQHALSHAPDHAQLALALASGYLAQANYTACEHVLLQAMHYNPKQADLHAALGALYHIIRHFTKALYHCQQAMELDPSHLAAITTGSAVLMTMGATDEAETLAKRALELDPNSLTAWNGIGNAHMMRGDVEQAEAAYRQAIAIDPLFAPSYRNLSALIRFKPSEECMALVGQMQQAFDALASNDESRLYVAFALGKAWHDLQDYDQAFRFYEEGNALMAKQLPYHAEATQSYFNAIRETYTATTAQTMPTSTNTSKRPIFILGMPRSGTTLVEQILASHANVFGGDELGFLGDILQARAPHIHGTPFPDYQIPTTQEQLDAIATDYLAALEKLDPAKARVTDKMPSNFNYIGLILKALPGAAIIHCRRNPVDICFSIYRQLFSTGIDYAYSFESIIDYYRQYDALMAHWETLFPGRIFSISYEALTENPEPYIRSLLAYCDLPWQDQCLAFHTTKRTVRTASTSQVRQPLYRNSVNAWKPYEKHLQPLLDAFPQT